MSAERPRVGQRRGVVLAVNSLARGGAETQLVGVAAALREAGHPVTFLTLTDTNDFAPALAEMGAERVVLGLRGPASLPGVLVRMYLALRRVRPAASLSFLYQITMMMRLVAPLAGVPRRISSVRNERLETRLRAVLFRLSCASDHLITTNSRTALQALQASRTIRRDRCAVVYNGVDTTRFESVDPTAADSVRRQLGVPAQAPLFLGVGRLAPQKNWPLLVHAAARSGLAHAHWAIAGEGEGRAELEALIADVGLTERVHLLGLRADVPVLLSAADALVLSSDYEGTPNVVLEALAVGRPIIATDVGACRELVGPGQGSIVETSRPDDLAEALVEFSRAHDLAGASAHHRRDPHTRVGDERLRNRFDWGRIGAQWVALIGPAPLTPAAQTQPSAPSARDRQEEKNR